MSSIHLMRTEAERCTSHAAWLTYWVIAWVGTTLAGGVFGAFFGLFGLLNGSLEALTGGFLLGLLWAGFAGLIAMPHIALLKWMFWCECSPRMLAGVAGAVTGLLTFLPFVTAPMGAAGAVLLVTRFLGSESAAPILAAEKIRLERTTPRRRSFSLADLFWRMTAVAVLISFWTMMARL